jgi:hypothetical protein
MGMGTDLEMLMYPIAELDRELPCFEFLVAQKEAYRALVLISK